MLARAAELLCGHFLPVARAARLMTSMLGVGVSTGFMAGVRGRAARLLEISFLPRVRELLRQVGVLHVDETPARADGALSYVHVASTQFLTVMHTGGRSKADIGPPGTVTISLASGARYLRACFRKDAGSSTCPRTSQQTACVAQPSKSFSAAGG